MLNAENVKIRAHAVAYGLYQMGCDALSVNLDDKLPENGKCSIHIKYSDFVRHFAGRDVFRHMRPNTRTKLIARDEFLTGYQDEPAVSVYCLLPDDTPNDVSETTLRLPRDEDWRDMTWVDQQREEH